MLNRKLLEVLKRLDGGERKRLQLFLASPYFNDSKHAADICTLCERILQYDAEIEHPALAKKLVSGLIYPDFDFEEKTKGPIDVLASNLFQLVQRFLAQQDLEYENTEVYAARSLARFYRKHELEERYWKAIQMMRATQERSPWRDANYYYWQFRIEEEEMIFRGLHNAHKDDMNLHAAQLNLDIFYSIQKMELSCALEHQKQSAFLETSSNSDLLNTLLQLMQEGQELDVPLNQIYLTVLELIKHPEEERLIEKLEYLLHKYKAQIPLEKLKDLNAYYRNYWIFRYYQFGDSHSRQRVFEVYQDHLAQGLFYQGGMIPFTTARNIMVFGLKLGEYEWVKQFLETHPPERICGTRYPIEAYSLNTADYYFALKEYNKAQDAIVYRNFENSGLGILADILLIKIYFETNNELLAFRMKALDQKIRRSKLAKEMKERYLNFLRYLDKIEKYGWEKRSDKHLRLSEKIKTTSNVAAREWLLEKLQS